MKANPKIHSGRFLRIPTGDEFLSNLIRYVVPGAMIAVTVGYAAIHFAERSKAVGSNADAMATGHSVNCRCHHPSENDRIALSGGAGNNVANK